MDPKLEQAVQAIKSGNKSAGLVLLAQVIRSDPNNESAWIWMATAQDDPEKKKQSLERVLKINPANERVRRAMAVLFPPAVQPASAPAVAEPETAQPGVAEQALPAETVQEAGTGPSELTAERPQPTPPTIETVGPTAVDLEAAPAETSTEAPGTAPMETAAPDLSWLKETAFAPEQPKEEPPDLSWLKEDLHEETPASGIEASEEPSQPEGKEEDWSKEGPATSEGMPDLAWLKEDNGGEEEPGFTWPTESEADKDISSLSWLKEEPATSSPGAAEGGVPPAPTGEKDELAWLRTATTEQAGEPAAEEKSESDEPDFSWLAGESTEEETPSEKPSGEPAFPWLNEAAPAEGQAAPEGQAVKNDEASIPDWLRQAQGAEAEPPAPSSPDAGFFASSPAEAVPPTLETERLRPEDIDEIAAKPAELPFTWDEVTGKPVLKSEAAQPVKTEAQAGEEKVVEGEESSTTASTAVPQPGPTPAAVSRPRQAGATAAPTRTPAAAAPAKKKGMTRGQTALLVLLGLATLIVLAAFAFYLAVNFGWLKAFGF